MNELLEHVSDDQKVSKLVRHDPNHKWVLSPPFLLLKENPG